MKKIIILILSLFISYNISFASDIRAEVIKGAINPIFSEDGKKYAYILLNNDGTKSVVFNKVIGKHYKNINSFIYISKDGNSIFYIAYLENGKEIVVNNGIEGKEYDYIKENLIKYSTDGKHFAYIANKNGKDFIVKDGIEGKKYDEIYRFYLSPDGKNILYLIERNGKQIVIKDGVEGKKYDYSYIYDTFKYSLEANSYVFLIVKNKKSILIKDGVEGKEYDNIYSYKYSIDGKHFAYIANKDGKDFIVKDGIEGKKYDGIYDFEFSLDGKHLAYTVRNGLNNFIVIDGVEGKKYKSLITIFPGVEKFVYKVANKNDKIVIVKDGIESNEYDGISYFIYSPDGNKFTYKVWKNLKRFFVKDGEELYECDELSKFIYSQDGKHFAYKVNKDGKDFIVKDGIEGKKYDGIYDSSFRYSLDGKHFAYIAVKNGKYIIVIDGEESNEYDFISGFDFLDNLTQYYVKNNNINYIIKEKYLETNKTEINNNVIKEKENNLNLKNYTPTEKSIYSSMYMSSKSSLIGTKDEKYINKINNVVSKMNKENLETLFIKVKNINSKNKVIKYLEAKIYFQLNNNDFSISTDNEIGKLYNISNEATFYTGIDKTKTDILGKYGFSNVENLISDKDGEQMLLQLFTLRIADEYNLKSMDDIFTHKEASEDYKKGLEELEKYKK